MNSAAGTVAGMGREARDSAKERFKEAMGGVDFVSREEFDDPALYGKSITITEVRVSPDLKNATAFVAPLGGEDMAKTAAALRSWAVWSPLGKKTGAKYKVAAE